MRRGGPGHILHLHGKEAQHQLPDALHLPVGWVSLHGSANGRSRPRLRQAATNTPRQRAGCVTVLDQQYIAMKATDSSVSEL